MDITGADDGGVSECFLLPVYFCRFIYLPVRMRLRVFIVSCSATLFPGSAVTVLRLLLHTSQFQVP